VKYCVMQSKRAKDIGAERAKRNGSANSEHKRNETADIEELAFADMGLRIWAPKAEPDIEEQALADIGTAKRDGSADNERNGTPDIEEPARAETEDRGGECGRMLGMSECVE